MTILFLPRALVEANVESAANAYFEVATQHVATPINDRRLCQVGTSKTLLAVTSRIEELRDSDLLILPLRLPILFTGIDPMTSPELLRLFCRGVVRAARAIWANERKPGLDFDANGLFYRRPFGRTDLAGETVVFVDPAQRDGIPRHEVLQELVLCALGTADEGLPRLELFVESCKAALAQLVGEADKGIDALEKESLVEPPSGVIPAVPLVTSLSTTWPPAWLSYEQWLRKLEGTPQDVFIRSDIQGPQRVDGPAGSGKTLSLVLKALYTLRKASLEGREHHAALIVFSEETRHKILASFLEPLDEDGFHTRDRNTERQSLTVTTLLSWSRRELASAVGPFQLSDDSPAGARKDQHEIVADVLNARLPGMLSAAGSALSHDLRELSSRHRHPVVVRMFTYEFGVVIKGMADGVLRRYLAMGRPVAGLPCTTEADRRFVYALFEQYERELRSLGIVDLDDVAVSHIKLLQMPLRREAQEKVAFDSVFIDEAHSFNPNDLGIFFLLTRRSELPPLVVAVDLPQGLGDKGYEGEGLKEAMFRDLVERESIEVKQFDLVDVRRSSPRILALAASIYAQGHRFLEPVRVPPALSSVTQTSSTAPVPSVHAYNSVSAMIEGAGDVAERVIENLKCRRSDVILVLMHDGLEEAMPRALKSRSEFLATRSDVDAERRAERANHFVVSRPEFLHGLEYRAAIIVGVSENELPKLEQGPLGAGAAAVFETQRAVDLLYLALTRAREQVALLYVGSPSLLLKEAVDRGLVVAG